MQLSMIKQAKQIILGAIGGVVLMGSINSLPTGGQMKEVNIVGERATYVFKCDDKIVSELSDGVDYRARFVDFTLPNPTKEGCSYMGGSLDYLYNTADGNLHENEYAKWIEDGKDKIYTKLEGNRFLNLSDDQVKKLKSIK